MAIGIASFPVKNHRFDALKVANFLRFQADNLDVDTIVFQSGNTVRYTFNGSPDLSEIVLRRFLTVNNSTNAVNDGAFIIEAVDDGSDFIDVINPARTSGAADEATDSPATAGTIEPLTVPASANQGSLFVEKVLEVPAFLNEDGGNAAPAISGLTLVNTSGNPSAPAAGQFSVNYDTGEFIFNSAQAGTSFEVDYFGKGSLVEEEEINKLQTVALTAFELTLIGDEGDPYLKANSPTIVADLLYKGSAVAGTPIRIKVIVAASGSDIEPRVWIIDFTNGGAIIADAKVGPLSGPPFGTLEASVILDLGALSNIPTGEAIWQVELSDDTDSGDAQISYLAMDF